MAFTQGAQSFFKGGGTGNLRGGPMSLIFDDKFRRTVQRFRYESRAITEAGMYQTLTQIEAFAVKEAQNQLKMRVYNAPLPQSAFSEWWTPQQYMELRRLGKVWRAIKAEPPKVEAGIVTGEVKVDRNDFANYYYARVLNDGATTINYSPRPFWTVMVIRVKAAMRSMARNSLNTWKLTYLP